MLQSRSAHQVAERQRSKKFLRYVELIIPVLVIARCAWIFGALLRSPDLPLRLAQDDFYYYLKPAQNLAWFHHSTFFGNTLTNGYHPLYFALLTVMSLFVRTLPGVYRFLWVLDVLSASAIFFLSRRLFARVTGPVLRNALAVLITALCITQICNQMEVTLALPFGFAFLLLAFVPGRAITARRAMLMGLFAALTFLSRLDAALLIALYVAAALCTQEYRAAFTPKNVASFLCAFLPMPLIYFWINRHFFHTFLPISGMAKELRHGWAPSILLPTSFNGTSEALVDIAFLAAVLAWVLRGYLRPREKVFLFATLASPFLFYGLEMIVSDWPVWNWYFYALRFGAAGAGLLVAIVASRPVIPERYPQLRAAVHSQTLAAILCAAALAKLFTANYNVDHWMVEIQHAAGVLDEFARTHPGVYAMGDRAGMFAITTSNPVLQTEGLVMDRSYLEHIRRQDDLRSVLASYGVNYFVAFVFRINYKSQFDHGCFNAMEPSIAGRDALRMRARFCEPPVYEFPAFDGKYVIYRIDPSDRVRAHS